MNSNAFERVNQWLAELGVEAEGGAWKLGDFGRCVLVMDQQEVAIEWIPEHRRLGVATEVATASEALVLSHSKLMQLLTANFLGSDTGGATLSIHPPTQALMIGVWAPVDALDVDRLRSMLVGIADQARRWKPQISGERLTSNTMDDNATHLFV